MRVVGFGRYEEELRHLRLTLATVQSEREAMKTTFDEDLSILTSQPEHVETQREQLEAEKSQLQQLLDGGDGARHEGANGDDAVMSSSARNFVHSTPAPLQRHGSGTVDANLQRHLQAFTDSMCFNLDISNGTEQFIRETTPTSPTRASPPPHTSAAVTSAAQSQTAGSFTRELSTEHDDDVFPVAVMTSSKHAAMPQHMKETSPAPSASTLPCPYSRSR